MLLLHHMLYVARRCGDSSGMIMVLFGVDHVLQETHCNDITSNNTDDPNEPIDEHTYLTHELRYFGIGSFEWHCKAAEP